MPDTGERTGGHGAGNRAAGTDGIASAAQGASDTAPAAELVPTGTGVAGTLKGRVFHLIMSLAAAVFAVVLPVAALSIINLLVDIAPAILPAEDAARFVDGIASTVNRMSATLYVAMLVPAAIWSALLARCSRRGSIAFPALSFRGFRRVTEWGKVALLSIGAQYSINIIFVAFIYLAPGIFASYQETVGASGFTDFSLAWLISTILLPPLVEELVFRGVLLTHLRRSGIRFAFANALQALCFGIYHMNVVQGIYAFSVGLLLGYLVWRYRSLVPGMLFHAVFNLTGTWGTTVLGDLLPEVGALTYIVIGLGLTVVALLLIGRPHESRGSRETV